MTCLASGDGTLRNGCVGGRRADSVPVTVTVDEEVSPHERSIEVGAPTVVTVGRLT
jgi:hypothetical protein